MMILERTIKSYNTDEAYLKHQVIKNPTDEQIAHTIKMSSIRELDFPKSTVVKFIPKFSAISPQPKANLPVAKTNTCSP